MINSTAKQIGGGFQGYHGRLVDAVEVFSIIILGTVQPVAIESLMNMLQAFERGRLVLRI